jgi:hypothetical protein
MKISKSNNTVAKEILNTLGGSKFIVMTGAKDISYNPTSLMFKIPLSNKINHVKIELLPNDTYKVTFGSIRSVNYKVIKEFEDVYNNKLRELFESNTGLYTSISEMTLQELELENSSRVGQPFVTREGKMIMDSITINSTVYVRQLQRGTYLLSDCAPRNCPVADPKCGFILTSEDIAALAKYIRSRF